MEDIFFKNLVFFELLWINLVVFNYFWLIIGYNEKGSMYSKNEEIFFLCFN